MKKAKSITLVIALFTLGAIVGFTQKEQASTAYEFQQVTTIESVVPGGMGRSRMISIKENGQMEERKLENFFSMVGINFGNIRYNDQMITDMVSYLTSEGWEMANVTSGVYSQGDGGTGIFITRYLFKRAK